MNIKPSERVASVQEYYLQRKMKEVAALNAAGADIVSLGVGGPDMPPPPPPWRHYARKPGAPPPTVIR